MMNSKVREINAKKARQVKSELALLKHNKSSEDRKAQEDKKKKLEGYLRTEQRYKALLEDRNKILQPSVNSESKLQVKLSRQNNEMRNLSPLLTKSKQNYSNILIKDNSTLGKGEELTVSKRDSDGKRSVSPLLRNKLFKSKTYTRKQYYLNYVRREYSPLINLKKQLELQLMNAKLLENSRKKKRFNLVTIDSFFDKKPEVNNSILL